MIFTPLSSNIDISYFFLPVRSWHKCVRNYYKYPLLNLPLRGHLNFPDNLPSPQYTLATNFFNFLSLLQGYFITSSSWSFPSVLHRNRHPSTSNYKRSLILKPWSHPHISPNVPLYQLFCELLQLLTARPPSSLPLLTCTSLPVLHKHSLLTVLTIHPSLIVMIDSSHRSALRSDLEPYV